MGTGPICLGVIFVLAWENYWKIANLNSTIEYTSTDRSEKKIARFSLEKISNVNKPLPCTSKQFGVYFIVYNTVIVSVVCLRWLC